MDQDLKNLIDQIEKYQNDDIDDSHFDKLSAAVYPGAKLEIVWKDRDESDYGYVFCLPGQYADEGDASVHVPSPDNSGGMGDAPEVHIHLYDLLSNEMVTQVIVN